MGKVKGSLLLEIARLIRANKDRNWDKYLTEQDKEIIFSKVLASSWYPLETYERAGYAIFMEIGQGKLENAYLWGRFVGEDIIKKFYSRLAEDQDPLSALKRFTIFRSQWFQFDTPDFKAIDLKQTAPKEVEVRIASDHPTPYFEPYTHQVIGTFERLLELNGAQNIKIEIIDHNWEGENPFSVLRIRWE